MLQVLIVEDNKIPANTAKMLILKNMDAVVTIASTGEEALDLFDSNQFDIIFMDIGLGKGIDGAETTKLMRDIEAKSDRKRTHIYALTAHVTHADIIRYEQVGIDKTFEKPLTDEKIAEVLEDIAQ